MGKWLFTICMLISIQVHAGVVVSNIYDGEKKLHYLPIMRENVQVSVREQVSQTILDQVFTNDTKQIIEGYFIATIPMDAVITSFSYWKGSKEIKAKIEERLTAKQIYQKAKKRELAPALLEIISENRFMMKLDQIKSGKSSRVKITYEELLPYANGTVTYRLPFLVQNKKQDTIENFSLKLDVHESKAITNSVCSWSAVELEQPNRKTLHAEYKSKNVKISGDLIVMYNLFSDQLGASVLMHRPEKKKDGYILISIAPKENVKNTDITNKDIMFVFDTSGSMEGYKLEQARKALLFALSNMNDGDGLNILGFSSDVNEFRNKIVTVDSVTREKAKAFTESLEAGGGTAIQLALQKAFHYFKKSSKNKHPKLIIFMTDGLGDRPPQEIIDSVKKMNTQAVRIFTFGVGKDVNDNFLDDLATNHRGEFVAVKETQQLELVLSRFYASIARPVLSDVELDFGDATLRRVYPQVIPDVYQGKRLLLVGRFSGSGKEKLVISGKEKNKPRNYPLSLNLPEVSQENAFVAKLWAYRRIMYLDYVIRKEGKRPEYIDEIISLSKKYGFITDYTSFVAVDEPTTPQHGVGDTHTQDKNPRYHYPKQKTADDTATTTQQSSGSGHIPNEKDTKPNTSYDEAEMVVVPETKGEAWPSAPLRSAKRKKEASSYKSISIALVKVRSSGKIHEDYFKTELNKILYSHRKICLGKAQVIQAGQYLLTLEGNWDNSGTLKSIKTVSSISFSVKPWLSCLQEHLKENKYSKQFRNQRLRLELLLHVVD